MPAADRYSNCLVAALFAWAKSPRSVRVRLQRNRLGRWHVAWIESGRVFEFYAKGRAAKPYWQNLIYRGCVRHV